MGAVGLDGFLARHRRLAFDTNVFIYQLEANPRYLALTDRVFAWLEKAGHRAVTPTTTLAELLVLPYRHEDLDTVNVYFALLTQFPNLDWVALDLAAADTAARLRATHRLTMPDALLAAVALQHGATGLVTNDPALARVEGIETLVLDDWVPEA